MTLSPWLRIKPLISTYFNLFQLISTHFNLFLLIYFPLSIEASVNWNGKLGQYLWGKKQRNFKRREEFCWGNLLKKRFLKSTWVQRRSAFGLALKSKKGIQVRLPAQFLIRQHCIAISVNISLKIVNFYTPFFRNLLLLWFKTLLLS